MFRSFRPLLLCTLVTGLVGIGWDTKSSDAQILPTYINGQFTLGNASGPSPYDYADTFFLESNPNASKTIYLDFNGHHSVNNAWNHDIQFEAFDRDGNVNSFSNSELLEIQRQFQNVAEDFLPFDVNVTTRDPGEAALIRSDANDQFYGIRAINTQTVSGFYENTGGVAYLNSFSWNSDTPVFTFNKGENNGAMTNSHEVGHALGLHHDGLTTQTSPTYHRGVGSGDTGWGPIMGAPFGKNLTQWSNGDYANSTNTEDDLAIITKEANGFDFRDDMVGDDIFSASELTVAGDGSIFDWGIIERNTDLDFFQLDLTTGDLDLSIEGFQGRGNLDIYAALYDVNGTLIAESNPVDFLDASFQMFLNEGTYFLSIDGTGKAGVYSDYGSLGFYSISGSFSAVPEPSSLALVLVAATTFSLRRRRRASFSG